jgi:hypothetical protein
MVVEDDCADPVENFMVMQDGNCDAVLSCTYPTAAEFNIYRDGELIAESATDLTYTDERTNFDVTLPHTWEVTVVCDAGEESYPVSVSVGACKDNFVLDCNETAPIGTGTTNSYYVPFAHYYGYGHAQQIYDQSEIGLTTGTKIYSISFQWGSATTVTRTNQTIYLKNVTNTSDNNDI